MEQYSLINKRGQAWGLDLTVAGVIFAAGIIILYFYAMNYGSQSQKQLDELFYEGNLAAELILSNEDFGILSNQIVNQTKLDQFYVNYTARRSTLGIKDNFYFFMEGLEIGGSPADYVGINSTETENRIQISRITVYKEKPTKFLLYVWS